MARQDPPLKPLAWYKKLATKRGRLAAGMFLVEGERAIRQIAAAHAEAIVELLTTSGPDTGDLQVPIRHLTPSQFRSVCATQTPQGLAAVVRFPPDTYSDQLPPRCGAHLLVLEDIQDPGNVGTLIRTAAAFRFSGVLLTDKCADPFAPKCVQATAGSVLSVWLRRTPHYLALVESLQQQGYTLAAADLKGQDEPTVLSGQKRLLLALGNETSGLSPALLQAARVRFAIPMDRSRAESLNVATCGAIGMYLSAQTALDLSTGVCGHDIRMH
jgi:TrmH family RNA methyltransferase